MKILIVDDEPEISEIMEFLIQDTFPPGTQTIIASSGNKAIKKLGEDNSIDICICDHNMADGKGSDVLKYLIDTKLKTKFILCSTVVLGDNPREYPTDFVFFNIQKPDIGKGVESLFEVLKKNLQKEEEPVTVIDEFVPVTIHVLSIIGKAPADVYLRMSDDKFIKCINEFEDFSAEDVDKYNQKGIHELYIKRGSQTPSVKEVILDAIQKIMDRKNIPLSDRMSIAHSQLVELIKFTGITPELAEASKKNVQQSVDFIMKSSLVSDFWKNMNLLGDYPSKLYTLQSMLALIVLRKLHWNYDIPLYKLTLASFLQDLYLDSIALMEISDYKEFLENASKFSTAEIKKYNEHPIKAASIAASFKEMSSDIERILIEQSEMPDGNGFPKKLNATQLGQLTCVFILTGIFARRLLKEGDDFDLDVFSDYLESRGYSRGNFKDAFTVIKTMKPE